MSGGAATAAAMPGLPVGGVDAGKDADTGTCTGIDADSGAPFDTVLVINAGSSSLKFGLYPRSGAAHLVGQVDGLAPGGQPRLCVRGQPDQPLRIEGRGSEAAFDAALAAVLAGLAPLGAAGRPRAVAHRIVHGGSVASAPQCLDVALIARLQALSPLAPLHQPHNLAGVAACARALPGLPQIGCFDTAFHAGLPEVEQALPLPAELTSQGLRRYGFHGLSYEFVNAQLRAPARRRPRRGERALLAHLGNGASLCATRDGRSVATTMGFSALDGLMMGSRSGSLDPGVLLHLLRQGWSADQLEALLYQRSGLRGVSGLSADMRKLRAAVAAGQAEAAPAARAIALFTHRLVREAGALAAVLGGLDLVGFTGGIGEHDARLRAALAEALAHLGVRLDAAANDAATGDAVCPVHAAGSAVELWVVPTDEGRVAAQAAFALLDAGCATLGA